jgi:hypothetical protein
MQLENVDVPRIIDLMRLIFVIVPLKISAVSQNLYSIRPVPEMLFIIKLEILSENDLTTSKTFRGISVLAFA